MTIQPSRRQLLGAGAAGAGAAAIGLFDVQAAIAQTSGDDAEANAQPPAATFGEPLADPPIIAGTRTLVVTKLDGTASGAGVDLTFTSEGVYSPNGTVRVPLRVEPFSRIARIDYYGWRSATGTVSATLYTLDTDTQTLTNLGTLTSPSGTGVLQASYTTPFTVSQSDQLYLLDSGTSSTVQFSGGIVTYYDHYPQLNLLGTPVRTYDSRFGFNPATGPKTPLLGGQTRTIDCQLNGTGVPDNARAVLLNVTCTNTSANGFISFFRGDIAWPGTSTMNWDHANTNVASTTVVACTSAGLIRAYVGGVQTDFIVDVLGYYA
jgi:hypothetical protein